MKYSKGKITLDRRGISRTKVQKELNLPQTKKVRPLKKGKV